MRTLPSDPITAARRHETPGYTYEEGVIVDGTESDFTARGYVEQTRYISYREQKLREQAEEARWAALAGPVTVRYKDPS